MGNLSDRHHRFWNLHQSGCFVIPNPWDIGSARLMAAAGAEALATTSSGFAFTLGRSDMGHVSRDEALQHAQQIVGATSLPVSGDLENGFGDDASTVAETVVVARDAGLSGGSIEDTQMIDGNPAYEFDHAIERVAAAVDAARQLNDPFILCARADGVMNGSYDMDEAIRRSIGFASAGADLIYVPLMADIPSLQRVLDSVDKPVNVLAAGALANLTVDQLAELGVRRISVGSMIARVTHAATVETTTAILKTGSFSRFSSAASGAQIDAMLEQGAG